MFIAHIPKQNSHIPSLHIYIWHIYTYGFSFMNSCCIAFGAETIYKIQVVTVSYHHSDDYAVLFPFFGCFRIYYEQHDHIICTHRSDDLNCADFSFHCVISIVIIVRCLLKLTSFFLPEVSYSKSISASIVFEVRVTGLFLRSLDICWGRGCGLGYLNAVFGVP